MTSESPEPPDMSVEGDSTSKSDGFVCEEKLGCVEKRTEPASEAEDATDVPVVSDGTTAKGSSVADNNNKELKNIGKALVQEKNCNWAEMKTSSVLSRHPGHFCQGEFGKMIQISQWSLTHRIKVCEVLKDRNERWRMSMSSRQEYARQTEWILTWGQAPSIPILQPASFDLLASPENWVSNLKQLEVELENSCFQDWAALTTSLGARLKIWRTNDEKEGWYVACMKNGFQPQEIFQAVEDWQLDAFKTMMGDIGIEFWALCPREYCYATPLHWAALHGRVEMVSFMQEEMLKRKGSADGATKLNSFVNARDGFSFTPCHMAIFPSLWLTLEHTEDSSETVEKERAQLAESCSRMMDSLLEMGISLRSDPLRGCWFILVTVDVRDDWRASFRTSYHSGDQNLHPLVVAIWIAHPLLIQKLLELYKGYLYPTQLQINCQGDTIFHLAAWGVNDDFFVRGRVMTLLLKYVHLGNLQNSVGETPLHIAVAREDYECVNALLSCPTMKVDISNREGRTPFHIATLLKEISTKTGVTRDLLDLRREYYSRIWQIENFDVMEFCMSRGHFKYNGRYSSTRSDDPAATRIFDLMITRTDFLDTELGKDFPVKELGKILQMSQWSLTHRIKICELLQHPNVRQGLTILTRRKYAEQSISLIKSTIQCDVSSSFPSLISERLKELPEEEKLINRNWKQLATILEKEVLVSLREKDRQQNWFITAFEGKAMEPHEIYEAVEVESTRKDGVGLMVNEPWSSWESRYFKWILNEHRELVECWECIKPGEYGGATPLHWAALHGKVDTLELMVIKSIPPEFTRMSKILGSQDDFDFTPLHMIIFSSAWISSLPSSGNPYDGVFRMIKLCVDPRDGIHGNIGSEKVSGSSFLYFKMTLTTRERNIFGTQLDLHQIYPIQLAICIAHQDVVDKFISILGEAAFVKTRDGDTILHLAAWGIQSEYEEMMNIVLRYLFLQPEMLNSCNNHGQTPLHIVVFRGKGTLVAALLSCHYIKVDVEDMKGQTPLQIAMNSVDEHKECFKPVGREFFESAESSWCPTWARLGTRFGISPLMKLVELVKIAYPDDNEFTEIISYIEDLNPESLRQRKILHISQWSVRHRILALQMLDENASKLEKIKDIYIKQCWQVAERLDRSSEGAVDFPEEFTEEHAKELRRKLTGIVITRRISRQEEVYQAIEQGVTETKFKELVADNISPWAVEGSPEFAGVPLLHWTVLHGRKDMVSIICGEIKSAISKRITEGTSAIDAGWARIKAENDKEWAKIVKARDEFGFTPLHLAAFSSLWHLDHEDNTLHHPKFDRNAEDLPSEVIRELYQNDFTHCASTGSQSNFILWNLSDCIFADDHYPENPYPIQLGVQIAHPCIVAKLLENCPEEAIVKSNSSGDTILHNAKAWNVLRKRSKVQWKRIEAGLLKHLDTPLISKAVNACNNKGKTPHHKAAHCENLEWGKILVQLINFEMSTSSGDTILHNTTLWNSLINYETYWKDIQTLLVKRLNSLGPKAVNIRNIERETALHKAVHIKSLKWVEALLGCEHINLDLRNRDGRTPRELAAFLLESTTYTDQNDALGRLRQFGGRLLGHPSVLAPSNGDDVQQIIYLIDCVNPTGLYRETETLQKERQVYVDAANAILVGAALIASASFGAWLQPPLGYKEYHEFPVTQGDTSISYESFVAIKQYWIIHLFWIFNSLSFFFSLATVIAGADAALPQQGLKDLKQAVDSVRNAVKRASRLLSLSVVFVIGTFITIGFAILPHIEKYRINMYCTVLVGLVVCSYVLFRLLQKLSYNNIPTGTVMSSS